MCLLLFAQLASFAASAIDVGVGTHMGQGKYGPDTVRQALQYLQLTSIRDEVYWDKVEVVPAELSTARVPSQIRAFFSTTVTAPRNGLLVLGYGNPNYEAGSRPRSADGQLAFARYAQFVASQYGPALGFLEIWNEWNLTTGYRSGIRGSPSDYARLVKVTVPAIRRSGFSGKVLIGGIGGDWPDWQFTRALLAENVLQLADGYSVHLYNFARSSQPSEMIARLKRLQQILSAANGGLPYPVYVTEVGWPSYVGKHGMSEAEAGVKLAVFLMESAHLPWLRGIWLYELFDGGPDRTNEEHNFGLFHDNGLPKEGACLVRGAIHLARRARAKDAGELGGLVRWLQFESESETYVVLYTLAPGKDATKAPQPLKLGYARKSLCDVGSPSDTVNAGNAVGSNFPEPLIIQLPGTGHNIPSLLQ